MAPAAPFEGVMAAFTFVRGFLSELIAQRNNREPSLDVTFHSAISTPAGPSGPHSFHGRNFRTGPAGSSRVLRPTGPGRGSSAHVELSQEEGISAHSFAHVTHPAGNLKVQANAGKMKMGVAVGGESMSLAIAAGKAPRSLVSGGGLRNLEGPVGFLGPRTTPRTQGLDLRLGSGSGRPAGRQSDSQQPWRTQHSARDGKQWAAGTGQGQQTKQTLSQRPQASLAKGPRALQTPQQPAERPQPGNEGAPALGADFGRKRSTRMVSKFHLGRQRPNMGKHSPNAEVVAEELLNLPSGGSDIDQVATCLEQWGSRLEGLEDYAFLLREVGNSGDCDKALACFDWLLFRQENGAAELQSASAWGKLASTTISTLGRLGQVEAAQQVFERARAAGMGSNVYAYSALLSAYGRSGRCKEVLELFQQMKDEGCRPNLITYNTVIDACGKGGVELERAWELFNEMLRKGVQPDRITYNSLMAVCGRAGQWQEAQRVFGQMEEHEIERDIFTFNTLIDALCKGAQMNAAAAAVEAMRAQGVAPNVVTFSTMVDGFGKAGAFTEAIRMYQELKDAGVKPDRVTYNTLLDIYGKAGRIEDALAVRQEMERAGWKTDVVTYNALIDAVGKAGRSKEAASLFHEMRDRGLHPNVLTWSALIGAYSKTGCHAEAMDAFREFRQAGLQADVVLYSALIDAFGKHGLVEEALGLLEDMLRQGVQPNIVTYNSLIDAYGRRGQVERALTTIEKMKGAGISPNAVTYNSVIDAYGKEGRADEALSVFQQMRAAGAHPDAVTFSALIDASGKRGDPLSAVKVFREMQGAGVKPNVVTFSAILSACSRCATCSEASQLLEEMQQSDSQVYGVAHGLLMGEARSRKGRPLWAEAESLFDALKSMDHCTGVAFYNALTDLLWHFGQRAGALKVLGAARRRRMYEGASWHSDAEGGVDLHLMSVGAAQAVLHSWLLDLLSIASEGRQLPRLLSVLTGWGKHSKVAGDSIVKRAVEARLLEMESPFRVARYNEGRIVAQGSAAREWLLAPRTRLILTLTDCRGSLTPTDFGG